MPVVLLPAPRRRCRREPGPAAVLQARQGALDEPPRRGPHVGAGPAPGRGAGGATPRASRPGPSWRSGWPCRPGTSRSASTSTSIWPARSTSTSLPARLTPALPAGIDCLAGIELVGRRAVAPAGRHHLPVGDRAGRRRRRRRGRRPWPPPWRRRRWSITRTRKGHEVTDDVRPAILALTAVRGAGHRRRAWPPSPEGCGPGELLDACFPGVEAHRVLRTHQWIERDGARREPVPVDATSLPHALRACA